MSCVRVGMKRSPRTSTSTMPDQLVRRRLSGSAREVILNCNAKFAQVRASGRDHRVCALRALRLCRITVDSLPARRCSAQHTLTMPARPSASSRWTPLGLCDLKVDPYTLRMECMRSTSARSIPSITIATLILHSRNSFSPDEDTPLVAFTASGKSRDCMHRCEPAFAI